MTRDELNTRIEKKNNDIAKIEKRISKWTTGMNDEAKAIVASCELVYDDPRYKEAYNAYNEYRKSHEKDPTVCRQDYEWNKGPNFGEAYNAYRDLAEAKATLNKYKVQLDKLTNFENEEKIEVIWNFLQDWKKSASEFYHNNAKLYDTLKKEFKEKFENYKNSEEYKERYEKLKSYYSSEWSLSNRLEREFREDYYSPIEALTIDIYAGHGNVDEEKLEKRLSADVKRKYTQLINQVTEKAGEILDASNLYIDAKGNIAGTVKGTKHTVNLWTTLSGGYNIQILHYRSYCSIAK